MVLGIDGAGSDAEFRAVLAEAGDVSVLESTSSATDLLDAVITLDPTVVLVHERMGPLPVLDLARELGRQVPHVAVVVASREITAEMFAEAMASGVRGLVSLPLSLEEVHARLLTAAEWSRGVRRVVGGGAGEELGRVSGRVFVVAGAKGGVGATTIAVRLALAATAGGQRVCLVDLDLQQGDVSTLLDITHRRTVLDLVEVVDDISSRALDETLYAHVSGIRVLLAPAEGERADDVTGRVCRAVLTGLRARFDIVVVDVGAYVTEAGAVAVEMADEVLLVATADVLAMKAAKRTARLWGRLQVRKEEDVRIVFNRVSRASEIQPDLARRTVGVSALSASIPAAFRALEPAVNTASPDRLEDAAVVRAYSEVAQELGMARPAATASGRSRRRRGRGDSGQASVEFLGVLPLILIALLIVWQFALLGLTWMFAGHAADTATRRLALGDTNAQVSAAGMHRIPAGWSGGSSVQVVGGGVTVRVATPILVPGLLSGLTFTANQRAVPEP